MKSTKVLYGMLATTALLAAGFVNTAYADETVSDTPANGITENSKVKTLPINVTVTDFSSKPGFLVTVTAADLQLAPEKNALEIRGEIKHNDGTNAGKLVDIYPEVTLSPYDLKATDEIDNYDGYSNKLTDGNYTLTMSSSNAILYKYNIINGVNHVYEGSTNFTIKNGRVVQPTTEKPEISEVKEAAEGNILSTATVISETQLDLVETLATPEKLGPNQAIYPLPKLFKADTNQQVWGYIGGTYATLTKEEPSHKDVWTDQDIRNLKLADGQYYFGYGRPFGTVPLIEKSNVFEIKDGKFVVPGKVETKEEVK